MPTPLTPSQRQGHWHFANSLALLLLRLVLGGIFLYTGSQKLFGAFGGMGMANWTHAMQMMNLPLLSPAAWAWIVACGEFFGGLFTLLGLLARLASLPLITTMLVAIATVHGKNGFMGIPVKDVPGAVYQGYAFNLTLIAMALALLLSGPGLISLDALLFQRSLWSRGPQPLDHPAPRP